MKKHIMVRVSKHIEITPALEFALKSLDRRPGWTGAFTLKLALDGALAAQAYRREIKENKIVISASDEAGFMYGILDLALAADHDGDLSKSREIVQVDPYLKNRGIKFNIPLDARTPSYSDASDSAAENIVNMWDKDFWAEFLDRMAMNKYNVLSLWSLSPFPSLVQIPSYPEVALADVKRAMRPVKATTEAVGMYTEDMEESLVTVKRMTIAEKISFWQWVMEYAKNRCIRVMLFTWNLHTFGTEHNPYGITDRQDNPVTKDYVYQGTKALLETYPLLAGLGVTAGEDMFKDDTDIPFIAATYGRAVKEMMVDKPERDFHFIHRMQYTRYDQIIKEFHDFPHNFEISFKYSQAHMYSNTKPVFIDSFLAEKDPDQKIWLTVRNDDFYMYRWGNPEFARQYIRQMPVSTMEGFYMGADGYTWGREYIDRRSKAHPLVLEKMWYMFFIWGQLSYNPDIEDEYFANELRCHFGMNISHTFDQVLYKAWRAASDIIPAVNCTHWHDYDFQWYPEGCCMYDQDVDKLVFADIREFISCKSVPGTEYDSIAEYCGEAVKGKATGKITPLEQADKIRELADEAMAGLHTLEKLENITDELSKTLDDIRALAYLGSYYSCKIKAAVNLCLLGNMEAAAYENEAAGLREEAVALLEEAADHWQRYAAHSKTMYRPQALGRLGGNIVDVERFNSLARLDVLLAQGMD